MFSLCLPGAPTIHMNGSQPVLKNERTHMFSNGNIQTDVKKEAEWPLFVNQPFGGNGSFP